MKSIIALLILIISAMSVSAQSVAVNSDGSQPDNSAILDIKSSSKGLLVPRLTTLQRTSIAGPALGLTVFDMDTYSFCSVLVGNCLLVNLAIQRSPQ